MRASLPAVAEGDPRRFHESLPGYEPTALYSLPQVARQLGIAEVLVKDESERLGLPAFKMLGASWATARAIRRSWGSQDTPLSLDGLAALVQTGPPRRLVAATDGNHGRSVARMARLLGLACDIYVPEGTADARIRGIESEGASVEVVPGSYDDAIIRAAREEDRDSLVISDTSWPGYVETPTDVINGYSTLFEEVDERLAATGRARPSHVFLQAGVGAFATSALQHYDRTDGAMPVGVIVEPTRANCLMRSAEEGRMVAAPGPHTSTMAGLNCGLPSELAWPVVYSLAVAYATVDDDDTHRAMRTLADAGVVSGESGAAGLAALLALDDDQRAALGLGPDSTVLVFNTEAATDPVNYRLQVGESPETTASQAALRHDRTGTNRI
ncbi:diaminopropionate ammonia-lyase [Leifsonia sp. AG29]|uniref:diaminopropionate ammonia-lyase n=1 Tax=Leifsonia sp. AG29 TaxID=2598860 RepID=UPI0018EED9B2|nr:diaminopropionate ammonia-lyase [Leifsonia sp. AG29]